jgi:L-lactate permease
MTKIDKKTNYSAWYIQCYARGIGTFFISFWTLLALGYAFDDNTQQSSTQSNEGMVLITFLALTIAGVLLAWRNEKIGGILLTLIGLAALVVFILNYKPKDYWVMLLTGAPILLSGVLFLFCWKKLSDDSQSQD